MEPVMPLAAGARLGPYQILSLLGAGGMGEVYRARDPRLGRDVALKVLLEVFARDPERMARFEREAQVLASLNHTNIAILYGLEESGGVRALVMEYVPGETLRGPLPVEEALGLARQMAEALEYAHDKGVIHRDLKPANVKITPDGAVKVLDFGLAKALDDYTASTGGGHNSPTLSLAATRAGVILGTAAYMPPEQAKGKPVDRRADIWAFGVVLYEMLTGRQMYAAETVPETLAFVMTKEPGFEALPPATPAAIRQLLGRCLEKDPKQRLRDIGEARITIEGVLRGAPPAPPAIAPPAVATPPPAPAVPAAPPSRWPWAIAVLTTAACLGVAFLHFREPPPERPVVRFVVPAPEKGHFGNFAPVISPDGRRVAFTASGGDGQLSLWIRSIDSLEAQRLPGTEDAGSLFWSPDSRFIGFFAGAKLKKVEAAGGPPQTLCDTPVLPTGAWSRDGVIVFGSPTRSGLLRISAAGGPPAPLTTLDASRNELAHAQPQFLPDGRHFLYYARASQPEHSGIYLTALDSKDRKRLLGTTSGAAYAPPHQGDLGHLLFLRDGTLMAQSFDAGKLDLAGDPFPVAEQVGSYFSFSLFSVSANGVLAYRTGGAQRSQLTWFDREGKPLGTAGAPGIYQDPALSPDGTQLAVSRTEANNRDIWVIDLARGIPSRFTFHAAQESHPVWAPDGSRIIFASTRDGPHNLYQKVASGAGSEEALLQSGEPKRPFDWSRDGRFLVYTNQDPKTGYDLWVLPMGGAPSGPADRKPAPYLNSEFNEIEAQFSPGPEGASRWMAYISNEAGQSQVYVQPFPASGGKYQISSSGGSHPRWRRDGKELFYIAPDGKLMSVEVKAAPKFEATVPKALFQTRITAAVTLVQRHYDVAPDGRRFLINSALEETASAPITVVMNWRR